MDRTIRLKHLCSSLLVSGVRNILPEVVYLVNRRYTVYRASSMFCLTSYPALCLPNCPARLLCKIIFGCNRYGYLIL